MTKRDYYEILGVPKGSDEEAIKKAYRKLAMENHPDRNPNNKSAEDKFKEGAEAYEVLSNPQKKAAYERYGHAGVDANSGGARGGNYDNVEDIFRNFGNIFDDDNSPFGSFFGGGGGQRARGTRGSDLRVKIKLTLEEIAAGVNKKIKVKKQVTCGNSNGSGAKDANSVSVCITCKGSGYTRQVRNTFLGQMATTATCPTCKGSGRTVIANCGICKGVGTVVSEETLDLNIPAGVVDGMQLQMSGRGNAGAKGGENGDLLINIEEIPHELFVRENMNIHHEVYINFVDATLGTNLEVPTLNGKVRIKVANGTQAGKIFRLEGKGLPSVQSYGRGDQLVHVNVWTPKKLNEEERVLLEKLRTMPNMQPTPDKEERGFFERLKDTFK